MSTRSRILKDNWYSTATHEEMRVALMHLEMEVMDSLNNHTTGQYKIKRQECFEECSEDCGWSNKEMIVLRDHIEEEVSISFDGDGDLLFKNTEGLTIYILERDVHKLLKFIITERCKKLDKFSVERSQWQECIKEGKL